MGKSGTPNGEKVARPTHWPRSSWNLLNTEVKRGTSLWVLGPRYIGKRATVYALLDLARRERRARPVVLDRCIILSSGQLNWQRVWSEIVKQAGLGLKNVVTSGPELADELSAVLARRSALNLAIGLVGARRGVEDVFFQAGSALHAALRRVFFENKDKLQVILSDEYALWYHEPLRSGSDWDLLRKIVVPDATATDIREAWSATGVELTDEVTQTILSLTGGHIGLIRELLARCPADILLRRYSEKNRAVKMMKILEHSSIGQRITNHLSGDPNLLKLAASYHKPAWLSDYGDPRAQFLRQLGIVQMSHPPAAVLSGEFMSHVVSIMAGSSTRQRGESRRGARLAPLTSRLAVTEDDFVLLHLSDLHLGDKHRFKLPVDSLGREHMTSRMIDLILEDLVGIGLGTRVQMVALTGDIAEAATVGEFSLAEKLIKELATCLSISLSHVLLVPGNHDVSFTPDDADKNRTLGNASPLNFDNLKRLIYGDLMPMTTSVASSPSGRITVQCVALNSCLASGQDTPGLGYVDPEELRKLGRSLSHAGPEDPKEKDARGREVRVLCLHHHVMPVVRQSVRDALNGKAPSLLLNSPEVLSWAAMNRFDALLHGHHHQPFVSTFERWSGKSEEGLRKMLAAGAGSCGARREDLDEFARNHYFVHIIRPDTWIVKSRALDDNGLRFTEHENLEIEL